MYDKTITLAPDAPNIPLDPIWSMRYSAGTLLFSGVPSAMIAAVLVLVLAGEETPFVLSIDLSSSVPAITIENGALSAVGQGDYYVYGFDSASRIYGLGSGLITIDDAPTLEAGAGVTPVSNEVRIYNPATGLYYLLTAELNDDGDATVKLTPEA